MENYVEVVVSYDRFKRKRHTPIGLRSALKQLFDGVYGKKQGARQPGKLPGESKLVGVISDRNTFMPSADRVSSAAERLEAILATPGTISSVQMLNAGAWAIARGRERESRMQTQSMCIANRRGSVGGGSIYF